MVSGHLGRLFRSSFRFDIPWASTRDVDSCTPHLSFKKGVKGVSRDTCYIMKQNKKMKSRRIRQKEREGPGKQNGV